MDAYEAPSTIKGGGLGLFLGEEHLKKGHRVGDILPRYQWPTDIKAAHGMDAVGVHAAADIGPHQEICAHAMTTRLMRARMCSPARPSRTAR